MRSNRVCVCRYINIRVFDTPYNNTNRCEGFVLMHAWNPIEWGHYGNGSWTATFDCLSETDREITIEVTKNLFDLKNLSEFFQHGKSLDSLILNIDLYVGLQITGEKDKKNWRQIVEKYREKLDCSLKQRTRVSILVSCERFKI